MKSNQRSTVVGVFETRQEADRAVEELRRAGFKNDQIGVAARNPDGTNKIIDSKEAAHAGEGALAGAIAGAGIGGLIGLGVLAGVVPVIGPAIAGGTLGVILSNAAAGGAVAGLTGALIGWGVSEEDATYYEGEMKSGRYVVTVHANGRSTEAWNILHSFGGYNREYPRTTTTTTAKTATATTGAQCSTSAAGGQTMKLHEEQLKVQKQPVQTGEVRVRKEVITEQKNIDVPVQREEVVIERRPVSGERATSAEIQPGQEIRIPVKEEQVRVEKEAVVKEEVRVGKRQVQSTEHVAGTVRKEQVKVERQGDAEVCDPANPTSKTGRTSSKSK